MAQAVTLNTIFARCAGKAAQNLEGQHLEGTERYMRLALKAQSQCRTTIETLAILKNPTTIFARQANIAQGPQQVNNTQVNTAAARSECRNRQMPVSGNGTAARRPRARARKNLGRTNYYREALDAGTAGAAGGRDSTVATVGAGDRTTDARGQGAGGSERGSRWTAAARARDDAGPPRRPPRAARRAQ